MKQTRKRYRAEIQLENGEIITERLYTADDADEGTSGYGVACRKRDELIKEKGLFRAWSRVVPVRVVYKWTKKDGFTIDSENDLTD